MAKTEKANKLKENKKPDDSRLVKLKLRGFDIQREILILNERLKNLNSQYADIFNGVNLEEKKISIDNQDKGGEKNGQNDK